MKEIQSGFAHLLLIVGLIGLIGVAVGVAYVNSMSSHSNKESASSKDRAESDQSKDAIAKANDKTSQVAQSAKDEQKPAESDKVEAQPAAPSPKPEQAPQPRSNATAFTNSNCNYTSTTVYISNRNGAPASANTPNKWQTGKTYSYGEKITASCDTWNNEYPDYVKIGDFFLKKTDLSPTAP